MVGFCFRGLPTKRTRTMNSSSTTKNDYLSFMLGGAKTGKEEGKVGESWDCGRTGNLTSSNVGDDHSYNDRDGNEYQLTSILRNYILRYKNQVIDIIEIEDSNGGIILRNLEVKIGEIFSLVAGNGGFLGREGGG